MDLTYQVWLHEGEWRIRVVHIVSFWGFGVIVVEYGCDVGAVLVWDKASRVVGRH